MIGDPGQGWALAMTVVSHEREPGELGFVARYRKTVKQLADRVRTDPGRYGSEQVRELGWGIVEAEMLRRHVSLRPSDRLDGIENGPEASVDKPLMTCAEQPVGHAALAIGDTADDQHDQWLTHSPNIRAPTRMGGTARYKIARR